MSNFELSCNYDEEILKKIKEIILNIHPIMDDRVEILCGANSPQMDIDFHFYKLDGKDITTISFTDGTQNLKISTPDSIKVNGVLSKKVICGLIEFLSKDHNYFSDMFYDYYNLSWLLINMDVDFGYLDTTKGISCGKIKIKLDFRDYPNYSLLANEYFREIIVKFKDKLKTTPTFKQRFDLYCGDIKRDFIKDLSDEQIHAFLNTLNSDDLRRLVHSIPNERFVELYNDYVQDNATLKLTDQNK